jgi:alpha-tubulin suppressor-like RCC1 family protein
MPRKTLLAAMASICLGVFSPAAQAAGDAGMGWGYNFYGQLGTGVSGPETCNAAPSSCKTSPTPMAGVSTATQISASRYHTLVLLADGTVRAWGFGTSGQLGNGGTSSSVTGVTVSGLGNVAAVAAGSLHSLALLADGTVVAWGVNDKGQLGLGSSSGPQTCGIAACSTAPVPVPGLSGVVAISAGAGYSLALLANGTVVAWGSDANGQLGDGTGIQTGCECVDHPVPVPGLTGAMAISAGVHHASALLADGTVRGWGDNFYGELGNGTVTSATPCDCLGPVAPSGISGAKAIAAGEFHSLALLADGTVDAWGNNERGQLGNGTVGSTGCKCVPSPAPVSGLSGAQAIATGSAHALALQGDGSVRAWGFNESGQLGNGSATETGCKCIPSVAAVGGLGGATAVSAGDLNSFALTGASQALGVAVNGAGAGTVGGPAGILCGASCSARYPQGQVEILRAEPAAGSAFAGWTGACTGTGTCEVRMDADRSVSATFGPPKGTAVSSVAVNRKKKKATLSFSAPGAVTGFQCKLTKPRKPVKKKHRKAHRGAGQSKAKAPKATFAACGSPVTYKNLWPGRYTFEVRALNALGADPSPAVKSFTVKAPKKHKAKHHR